MIRYKFTKIILILDVLLSVYAFGTALFSAFKLAGAFGMKSFSIFIDVSAIVISLFILLCIILQVFCSMYIFDEKQLKIRLMVFSQKISYSDIVEVGENTDTSDMLLYFATDLAKADFAVLPVNIDKSRNSEFVTLLRAKNAAIVYRRFSKGDILGDSDDPNDADDSDKNK